MARDKPTHDDVLKQNDLKGGEDWAAVQHWNMKINIKKRTQTGGAKYSTKSTIPRHYEIIFFGKAQEHIG